MNIRMHGDYTAAGFKLYYCTLLLLLWSVYNNISKFLQHSLMPRPHPLSRGKGSGEFRRNPWAITLFCDAIGMRVAMQPGCYLLGIGVLGSLGMRWNVDN